MNAKELRELKLEVFIDSNNLKWEIVWVSSNRVALKSPYNSAYNTFSENEDTDHGFFYRDIADGIKQRVELIRGDNGITIVKSQNLEPYYFDDWEPRHMNWVDLSK
jgi:hypothetical protein